jgi:hypothetical protein
MPKEENAQLLTFNVMNPKHFSLEHEIFILDAYLEKPLDPSKMESWTRGLIDALLATLRMEELGPLQIFPATDLRAPGWSFIQPITTSHIAGHYFEKPGKHPHIRLDMYSCESVNWKKLVEVLDEHLGMGLWRATFIDRQIDEKKRAAMHISGEGSSVLDELDLLDHENHLISAKSIAKKVKQGMTMNASSDAMKAN